MHNTLIEKQNQLDDSQNNLKMVMENMHTVQQQSSRLDEENKLFKRAIGIQEGRNREAGAQNQQLREALGQAIEHISNLERANNSLRDHLRMLNGPEAMGHYHHQPPPDVF